jgi:hypothetical protein
MTVLAVGDLAWHRRRGVLMRRLVSASVLLAVLLAAVSVAGVAWAGGRLSVSDTITVGSKVEGGYSASAYFSGSNLYVNGYVEDAIRGFNKVCVDISVDYKNDGFSYRYKKTYCDRYTTVVTDTPRYYFTYTVPKAVLFGTAPAKYLKIKLWVDNFGLSNPSKTKIYSL